MEAWMQDFKQVIDSGTPRLLALTEAQSEQPRAAGQWAPKEIIGHLIDSAANNHARFVTAQFKDDLVFSGYEQEEWVAAQQYRKAPWHQLVELWRAYNLHLLHVMSSAPVEKRVAPRARHSLDRIAFKTVPENEPATLEYLMSDYVVHLKHHLKQIFEEE